MSNYTAEVRDGKLVIIVDVSAKAIEGAQLSKSEKSKLLASTRGFTRFGNVALSMNVTVDK
jgi:uncharacterized protein YaaQ